MQSPQSAFWAMVTLGLGALCAYPFLRVPADQISSQILAEAESSTARAFEPSQAIPADSKASNNSAAKVKMVSSGEFSSQLSPGYPRPNWERQESDLEELVADGLTSSAPKSDAPVFPELPTWISQPRSQAKAPLPNVAEAQISAASVNSLAASPFARTTPSQIDQSLNRKLLDWPSESMALAEVLNADRVAKLVSGTASPQPAGDSVAVPVRMSPREKSYVFQPGHVPTSTIEKPD
ncbi:MAG: hypothetical protein VXZ82_25560 [Planctomycetota bacterium]|nr:hypothetical protein [Planctomycetota bacterium]